MKQYDEKQQDLFLFGLVAIIAASAVAGIVWPIMSHDWSNCWPLIIAAIGVSAMGFI